MSSRTTLQASHFYNLLMVGEKGNLTVRIYVDSWGIKRLCSLAIRRWKAPITTLRELQLHYNVEGEGN